MAYSIHVNLGKLLLEGVILFPLANVKSVHLVHDGLAFLKVHVAKSVVSHVVTGLNHKSLVVSVDSFVKLADTNIDLTFHILEGSVVRHSLLGLSKELHYLGGILVGLEIQVDEVCKDGSVVRELGKTGGKSVLGCDGILLGKLDL